MNEQRPKQDRAGDRKLDRRSRGRFTPPRSFAHNLPASADDAGRFRTRDGRSGRRAGPTSPRNVPVSLAAALLLAGLSLPMVGCDKPETSNDSKPAAESQQSNPDEEADTDRGTARAPTGEQEDSDATSSEESEHAGAGPPSLTGHVKPGRVTEVSQMWRRRLESVDIDEETARKLADIEPGATVTVYFGTWCGDSLREVPRLWKSLQVLEGDVPFDVDYIGLDHAFDAGDASIPHENIEYVPTFVVDRNGNEVGRIVESAPRTLERDLLSLLDGETEGVISDRKED